MKKEDLEEAMGIRANLAELKINQQEIVAINAWTIQLTAKGFLDTFFVGEYTIVEREYSFPKLFELSTIYNGTKIICLADEITINKIEGEQA